MGYSKKLGAKDNPCYGCTERCMGCHVTCKHGKDYSKMVTQRNRAIQEERDRSYAYICYLNQKTNVNRKRVH